MTMIFVFISMNLSFVYNLIKITPTFYIDLGIRVFIGLIAMIKISAAAAIVRGSRVGEKLPHALIVGGLVIAAPYVWMFLGPIIEPMLKGIGGVGGAPKGK